MFSLTGLRLTPYYFQTCKMDVPLPICFGAPIYFEADFEDVIIPGSNIAFTKCSSTMWVDVGWVRWVPHQFVARYLNPDGELFGPYQSFGVGDGGDVSEG